MLLYIVGSMYVDEFLIEPLLPSSYTLFKHINAKGIPAAKSPNVSFTSVVYSIHDGCLPNDEYVISSCPVASVLHAANSSVISSRFR